MKTLISLFILFNAFTLSAQETDFIVPANTQKILTSSERTLSLKKFSLGDNVTIIIPPEMNGWTVTATDASIGINVKIIGQAKMASAAPSGSSGANAPNCTAGYNGVGGTNGPFGMPGKNVSMNLKVRNIGVMTIQVNGGNGGQGGNGGYGGKGGSSTCNCNAGNGGNGGRGGNGGNGGVGGNVSIVYSKIGNVIVSNSNFIINNTGGYRGVGGYGGGGGQGGAGGGCSDPKALVKPAGASGQNGARGNDGQNGSNGTTKITAG